MAYTLRTEDHAGDLGRAADQQASVNNDIWFQTWGIWDDWVPVIVGYSADPANASYRYCLVNKTCYVRMVESTAGTSDDTDLTYSLPVQAALGANDAVIVVSARSIDNGSDVLHLACGVIATGTPTVLTCYKSVAGAAWTAAGNKCFANLPVSFFYETV